VRGRVGRDNKEKRVKKECPSSNKDKRRPKKGRRPEAKRDLQNNHRGSEKTTKTHRGRKKWKPLGKHHDEGAGNQRTWPKRSVHLQRQKQAPRELKETQGGGGSPPPNPSRGGMRAATNPGSQKGKKNEWHWGLPREGNNGRQTEGRLEHIKLNPPFQKAFLLRNVRTQSQFEVKAESLLPATPAKKKTCGEKRVKNSKKCHQEVTKNRKAASRRQRDLRRKKSCMGPPQITEVVRGGWGRAPSATKSRERQNIKLTHQNKEKTLG